LRSLCPRDRAGDQSKQVRARDIVAIAHEVIRAVRGDGGGIVFRSLTFPLLQKFATRETCRAEPLIEAPAAAPVLILLGTLMKKTIVLLPGDASVRGVACRATILRETRTNLTTSSSSANFRSRAAIDAAGTRFQRNARHLPKSRRRFFWSSRGPKWDSLPVGKRPESGLLALRKAWTVRQRSSVKLLNR